MARAARSLAASVRADARRLAAAGSNGAVVSRRCCSTRTIHVFYRSRPHSYLPWYGAYELTLRTSRTLFGAVTVSYFPTAANWTFGAPPQRLGPSYSFSVRSPGRHRGWSVTASDTFVGCEAQPGTASVCEGFSQAVAFEAALGPEREFRRLFRQAIVVVHKAERHAVISGENLFSGSQGRFSGAGTGS